jgi:hypothetical protein
VTFWSGKKKISSSLTGGKSGGSETFCSYLFRKMIICIINFNCFDFMLFSGAMGAEAEAVSLHPRVVDLFAVFAENVPVIRRNENLQRLTRVWDKVTEWLSVRHVNSYHFVEVMRAANRRLWITHQRGPATKGTVGFF